jgi:transposase
VTPGDISYSVSLEPPTQPRHPTVHVISGWHGKTKTNNELWEALESLFPVFTPLPKGGRRGAIDDRAALNGIQYVLRTGTAWEDLPQELGFGKSMTCWRRLHEHDPIDWRRPNFDTASVPSPRWAKKPNQIQRIVASSEASETWL